MLRPLTALLLISSVVLVAPAVSAEPVQCMGCDAIIALCQKVLHFTCVESTGPDVGPAALPAVPSDATLPATHVPVGHTPGLSCINCDVFNRVCERFFGVNCLG